MRAARPPDNAAAFQPRRMGILAEAQSRAAAGRVSYLELMETLDARAARSLGQQPHTGELPPGLVPPEGLRFHIREAVEVAGEERWGAMAEPVLATPAR